MARDGVGGGVPAERDFVACGSRSALAVARGAEHEERLLDAPDVPARDRGLRERAVAEIEVDARFL